MIRLRPSRALLHGAGLLLLLLLAAPLRAQDLPSIAAKTEGLDRMDGFFPLYWDAQAGTLWLEIPRFDDDLLYVVSLPAGLGSNDVGLDRGQLGGERIVRFERVGPKVLLVAPNLRYRAGTDDPAEARAVRDAFAESILWAFPVAAETDGRVLVDATPFVVRDAHGAARRLQQTGQGSFRLDGDRSALYPARTKAFPRNTEMEARLTFVTDAPGGYVRDVAADPTAVTLRVRHSLVALPEPGFAPRPFHPRSGFFSLDYDDYAVPIGEELTQRLLVRHRLQCAAGRLEPRDGLCAPAEPIVYYLDPGTPEPVRSALLEGARWWNEAFEAAGFRDAFRVELLPADADPMDVRYNVIQWVHRATRGWSYGATVVDPRTGEIIKGHVTLGSLRVRQDYLLAEGLLAPYAGDAAEGLPPSDDPMLAMALARIRQLSAHEVGHTLGLAHNFAASADGRASVMDYPAPLAVLAADGTVDLSRAYDAGIGAWDRLAIRFGYAPGDDASVRQTVLAEMDAAGLGYLTDTDARPPGAAEASGSLWDNEADPVAALAREMDVRAAALTRFSPAVVRTGQPLATMEEVLVPLYLRHRYQAEATAKLLGGVSYAYALRGGAAPPPAHVPADRQRAALGALLATLTPEALALPEAVRTLLPPRPPGYPATRELFDGYTGLVFDPYAPAETAARFVLDLLVQPERAARMVYQADADPALPDFEELLRTTTSALTTGPAPEDAYHAELRRVVQHAWVDALLALAADRRAAPAVRAQTTAYLAELRESLRDHPGRGFEQHAMDRLLLGRIHRFLERAYEPDDRPAAPDLPPGSPIGH